VVLIMLHSAQTAQTSGLLFRQEMRRIAVTNYLAPLTYDPTHLLEPPEPEIFTGIDGLRIDVPFLDSSADY
jgi:hypothetical protein